MPHPRETDEITLDAFRTAFPSGTRTALNTVGLLSRIDTLSDDDDPWPAARRQAARASERLGALVSTVVPVVGLLAETVGAGRLTEADAINVAKLAATDPATRARALIGIDQLRGLDPCDVSVADRERLVELLGLYGLRRAVNLVDVGARSATELSDGLREASGIDALERVLAETITARADLFKVDAAATSLTRLALTQRDALGPDASARIRSVVDRIRLDPDMHQLAEMDLLRELAAGTLDLPDDLAAELRDLLGPGTVAARLGIEAAAPADEMRGGRHPGGDALERGRERPAQQPFDPARRPGRKPDRVALAPRRTLGGSDGSRSVSSDGVLAGFVTSCTALAGTLRSDALAHRLREALDGYRSGSEDRTSLVTTLIQLGDLVDDDETAAVAATLQRAGVEVIDVTPGIAFDPSTQHAVDTTPTADRALDGLVAGTVRPGYRDGRTLLREPDVAVYRCT